ncbi:hypothetical protein CLF_107115 [Clonorchis sinensis]|uniref:Uncharacterized protein n=1 Tax=Clonorchis sinensis TaxID=79923 RepID=G7YG61_CLOSI|nr:hypothetical protein CLF_107115 [Clonorchis sinensis]
MASEVASHAFVEKLGAVSFLSFTAFENAVNQYMKEHYVVFVRSSSNRSTNAVLRYEWVYYKCSERPPRPTKCPGIRRSYTRNTGCLVRFCAFLESEMFAPMRKVFGLFKEMMDEHYPVGTFVMDKLAAQMRVARVVFGCAVMLCYLHIRKAVRKQLLRRMDPRLFYRITARWSYITRKWAMHAQSGMVHFGSVTNNRLENANGRLKYRLHHANTMEHVIHRWQILEGDGCVLNVVCRMSTCSCSLVLRHFGPRPPRLPYDSVGTKSKLNKLPLSRAFFFRINKQPKLHSSWRAKNVHRGERNPPNDKNKPDPRSLDVKGAAVNSTPKSQLSWTGSDIRRHVAKPTDKSTTWVDLDIRKRCENRTTAENVKLSIFSSTSSKVVSLIVDRVVVQDPYSQSHKPNHSEPQNPPYTQLARLIASDSSVQTNTKERQMQPKNPHQKTADWLQGAVLCEKGTHASATKKLRLGAATQRSGTCRDTFPIKPRQNAQEAKRAQVCPKPFNNSKSGHLKSGIERAASSSGRTFRPLGQKLCPPTEKGRAPRGEKTLQLRSSSRNHQDRKQKKFSGMCIFVDQSKLGTVSVKELYRTTVQKVHEADARRNYERPLTGLVFTMEDSRQLLHKNYPFCSSGPDEIHPRILNKTPFTLAKHFYPVFRKSLDKAVFLLFARKRLSHQSTKLLSGEQRRLNGKNETDPGKRGRRPRSCVSICVSVNLLVEKPPTTVVYAAASIQFKVLAKLLPRAENLKSSVTSLFRLGISVRTNATSMARKTLHNFQYLSLDCKWRVQFVGAKCLAKDFGEDDVVRIVQIDKVFVTSYLNTGIFETFQRSHDFIDHEIKWEWREWKSLTYIALCTEAFGELYVYSRTNTDTLKPSFKLRRSVLLAVLNVRTLKKAGQQPTRALTMRAVVVGTQFSKVQPCQEGQRMQPENERRIMELREIVLRDSLQSYCPLRWECEDIKAFPFLQATRMSIFVEAAVLPFPQESSLEKVDPKNRAFESPNDFALHELAITHTKSPFEQRIVMQPISLEYVDIRELSDRSTRKHRSTRSTSGTEARNPENCQPFNYATKSFDSVNREVLWRVLSLDALADISADYYPQPAVSEIKTKNEKSQVICRG